MKKILQRIAYRTKLWQWEYNVELKGPPTQSEDGTITYQAVLLSDPKFVFVGFRGLARFLSNIWQKLTTKKMT